MKIWGRANWLTLVLALWSTGCSRQLAVPASSRTLGSGQLPFDRVSERAGVSPTADLAEGIPAGTEVTVRLGEALSSADARVGDSFEAVLDESVIVAGKLVVPRGALVTGSVVDTRVAASSAPGYLRMTLVSIALNGIAVPLQTSSIFTKGGAYRKRGATSMNMRQADGKGVESESSWSTLSSSATPNDVRFSTGHRFSFRLIQPLHL